MAAANFSYMKKMRISRLLGLGGVQAREKAAFSI